jgi:hypothetical protein
MAGQNATFRGDEPTWANACVGENGDPQINEYASGFASAANLLLDQVISNRGLTLYVDTFIYPICFNMRLGRLVEIRRTSIPKFDMTGSHDLGKIWAYVKDHALVTKFSIRTLRRRRMIARSGSMAARR